MVLPDLSLLRGRQRREPVRQSLLTASRIYAEYHYDYPSEQ